MHAIALLVLSAPGALATKACLIWGVSKYTAYGVTKYDAFCDVQWPWGAEFWCARHLWPTNDPTHPGSYSQMIESAQNCCKDSQLVNSVYLDSSTLELYHGRLNKLPGAVALRLRWYGTGEPRLVYVERRAAQESEIPNFKGSDLGRFPLVSADFGTSDHLSERPRSVDAFSETRARGTLTSKRRRVSLFQAPTACSSRRGS